MRWGLQVRALVSQLRAEREAVEHAIALQEIPMAPLPLDVPLTTYSMPFEHVCGCNVKRIGSCLTCNAINDNEQREYRRPRDPS